MAKSIKKLLKKTFETFKDENGNIDYEEAAQYVQDEGIDPIIKNRVARSEIKMRRELAKQKNESNTSKQDREIAELIEDYENNPNDYIDYDEESGAYFDPETGEEVEYQDDDSNDDEYENDEYDDDEYEDDEHYEDEEDYQSSKSQRILNRIEQNKLDKELLNFGFDPKDLSDGRAMLEHFQNTEGVSRENALAMAYNSVKDSQPISENYASEDEMNQSRAGTNQNDFNIGNQVGNQNFRIQVKDEVTEEFAKLPGNEHFDG